MIHNIIKFGSALLLLLSLTSCHSIKNSNPVSTITEVWIGTPFCKPKKIVLEKTSTYQCLNHEFIISKDALLNEPLTIEEEFQNAFRGNYYAKFFEIIHIDSKLYRVFRDSVQLVSISDLNLSKKQLFSCPTCNKSATLIFRNRTYHYPFFWPETASSSFQYNFTIDTISGYYRKIWIAKSDSLPSGVTFRKSALKSFTICNPKTKDKQAIQNILVNIKPL